MKLLQNILGPAPPVARESPWSDYWYTPSNFATSLSGATAYTGEPVNTDTALRVSTVYACVKVLAETLATLPLKVYRRTADGKEEAPSHPLYELLHDQPNVWQTSFEFIEQMMGHCALNGNAIARIVQGPRGAVDAIEPLVGKIEVSQRDDMRLDYEWTREDGTTEKLGPDYVMHVRNWSQDGLVGMSPIAIAVDTIGRAIAQNKYIGSLYRDGAAPNGILTTEKTLGPVKRAELAEEWDRGHRGPSQAGKTAVVDQGLDWKATSMTAEDAQMIEAMKFSKDDICGIFRVPPPFIANLDKATYSNIENQDRSLSKHTMTPWCKRWVGAIRRDLIVDRETYFAEFNLDALQAGDIKARYEAHSAALGGLPFKTVNEVRREENYPPIAGGDAVAVPLNVERPGDRDDERGGNDPPDNSPEPPEPPDKDDARATAMAGLIEDAAKRIARREAKALGSRAKKAAEDPARFAVWAGTFFGQQSDAVMQTVAPLTVAWVVLGGDEVDVAGLAERIAAGGVKAIEGDPVVAVAAWQHTRAIDVMAQITRELV